MGCADVSSFDQTLLSAVTDFCSTVNAQDQMGAWDALDPLLQQQDGTETKLANWTNGVIECLPAIEDQTAESADARIVFTYDDNSQRAWYVREILEPNGSWKISLIDW